jgi:transcriptional regulator with XRE-family HTH domain
VAWDVWPVPRTLAPDPALASVLRRLRLEQGATQEALAHDSGITTGSLARIELGQSSPAWTTVRQIADALDVTMVEIAAAVEAA